MDLASQLQTLEQAWFNSGIAPDILTAVQIWEEIERQHLHVFVGNALRARARIMVGVAYTRNPAPMFFDASVFFNPYALWQGGDAPRPERGLEATLRYNFALVKLLDVNQRMGEMALEAARAAAIFQSLGLTHWRMLAKLLELRLTDQPFGPDEIDLAAALSRTIKGNPRLALLAATLSGSVSATRKQRRQFGAIEFTVDDLYR